LSNIRHAYTLVGGINSINIGELKEGGANNDDRIDSSDFLLLCGTYFKCEGEVGSINSADFDFVNSSDFLLLRRNYLQSGPIDLGSSCRYPCLTYSASLTGCHS